MKRQTFTALALAFCSLAPTLARADGDNIVATAEKAGNFKILVKALVATGLDEPLKGNGHFTVFAPTDEAFKKLPKGTVETLLKAENKEKLATILKYHVLPMVVHVPEHAPAHRIEKANTLAGLEVKFNRDGTKVKVNGANIVTRDIACENGVIQVIDAVLLPPAPQTQDRTNTIPAVAKKAGSFSTLLAALSAAELAEVLGGDGPFTVFAPTDEAFKKLPANTVETLLKPENKSKLQAILKYHVVAGKILAKDAVGAARAKTLQGQSINAKIVNGRLKINDAEVTASDIGADNGVIHVIDSVLIPKG